METRELTLKSGRQVKIRRPSVVLDLHVAESSPTLGAGELEIDSLEARKVAIRFVLEGLVEPKLWVDFRSFDERVLEPREAPPGRVDWDLSDEEFLEVSIALKEWREESMERIRPLRDAATS